MRKYILSVVIALVIMSGGFFVFQKASATDMPMRQFINILISINVIPAEKITAVNAWLDSYENPTSFTGTITNFTSVYKNYSADCGYCFVSDDGKYICALMTGKAFGQINSGIPAKNLDSYVGKKVVLSAKKYEGPTTKMCPITLDVEKIENIAALIPTTPSPVACTMDAKMCPDGSYVGRTGSKCEFVCPVVTAPSTIGDSNCLAAGESDIGGGVPTDAQIKNLKSCCAGLSEISPDEITEFEGQCIQSSGGYGVRCAPCGNGICEVNYGENKCTCATDCK